jgi:hypothetical protein
VFNRPRYRFAVAGFPIRTSSDQSLYTAPRGLSQCPTSFIGTWRQGILRKLLVASPRDAEKLILFCFGLHHQITIQLLRYCSPLTGDRCSQLTSRASVALQTIFFFQRQYDPATPPGHSKTLTGGSILTLCLRTVQQPLSHSSLSQQTQWR